MRRLLLAIAIAALPWISAAQKPTAKVEQGLLQGTVEEGLTVYRGIPFAAPPVGDLRWRAPNRLQSGKACGGRQFATAMRTEQFRSRTPNRAASADERGLPLFERLDAREVGFRPHPGVCLDLWRRVQCRRHVDSALQRRGSGAQGRGAGQHRVSRGNAGLSGASGVERGIAASCFGKLRPTRHDRRIAMD